MPTRYETPLVREMYTPDEDSGTSVALGKTPAPFMTTPALAAESGAQPIDVTAIPSESGVNAVNRSTDRVDTEALDDGDDRRLFGDYSSEIERIAEQRAVLLAVRYATKDLNVEQSARLRLLNERLKALLPPVTVQELTLLETMAVEGKKAEERLDEIRRSLGL